ncbi:hypothetical protein Cob_v004148 [Colletotrichum orbiculare MAFF 240422]|uniref:Uncharacterized protein n=1 Tax=Colletotrichum orbiculare (strain 104-T / ATCC 96160 / CBS 514.97 / LARS 414 / MAFF 240422) TaxID=1213857 RepID=A0A484FY67_COLOR|nr:hypothetical protein Cob_v004148 [Colletotrichum orbiculare MAFF 240422]
MTTGEIQLHLIPTSNPLLASACPLASLPLALDAPCDPGPVYCNAELHAAADPGGEAESIATIHACFLCNTTDRHR